MAPATQSHEPGDDAEHQKLVASGPTPRVTVIVPVRNDAQRLERCLRSVLATNHPRDRFQVIVADNGSTDNTPDVARALGVRVQSFPGMSVAAVRNQAARASGDEVLAFIDADHEVAKDWIPLALDGLARGRAGAIGAPYTAPVDGTWVQHLYDTFRTRPTGVQIVDWLPSGNLAVWRQVFESLAGFDTALETCEDVDFCQRLRGAGFDLLGDVRLRSVHYGDPSTLRSLFFGELWRGRDNLRVSLRGPWSLRALPSILIPIATLLVTLAALVGVVSLPFGGGWVLLAAGVGLMILATPRVVRMLSRLRVGPLTVPRAFAVALVYEVARALALVIRAPHHVRQGASLPPLVTREPRG